MRTIGLFGGTFDPIHFGHLNLAIEILEKRGLDAVWFIPANKSPFKMEASPTEPQTRLKMCQLALEGLKQFSVLDDEVLRPTPSYTIDTINEIQKRFPKDQFYLILGDESLQGFSHWKDPQKILEKVELLIGTREGKNLNDFQDPPWLFPAVKKGWTPIRRLEISSTEVRQRVKNKLPISHLIPHKVVDYISKNSLYLNL
jgi:nicotinate-nucleotide adenylyltransferase